MMTIREYKKAESLEEAWQLNQKKQNRVLGGMIWLKIEEKVLRKYLEENCVKYDINKKDAK